MSKQNVIHDTDSHEWVVLNLKKDGTPTGKNEHIPDVVPMGELESVQVFQNLVSKETDARRAALSLLCHIYMFSTVGANKLNVKKHIGKGDKKTGQLGEAIRDEFRDAESAYFKGWADEAHPAHVKYLAGLPKLNEKSQVLPEEERHSYFVTRTRKSPSYANAKNLFLNYLAFVGNVPYATADDDDHNLIGILPPEVMRARIADAKSNVPPADNSWEKRMQDLIRQLLVPENPEKPLDLNAERLPGLLQDLKMCTAEVQRQLKVKTRTAPGQTVNVPAEANKAVDKAKKDPAAGVLVNGKPLEQAQQEAAEKHATS